MYQEGNAPDLRRIGNSEITVGDPLSVDLFDAGGNLLLVAGSVIIDEEQLYTLKKRGLYTHVNTDIEDILPPSEIAQLASVAEELSERYKILRQIGKGGNGVVYLAQDQFEQREVAIKVASFDDAEKSDEMRHKLWMNEVRMASQLKHPFIVNTYEAGLINAGGYYIVMEYLSGGTLSPFIKPGNLLSVERVIEILFKVCKALEYVHSMGILHRDIKPGNILLDHNGEIKVSDFGSTYQTNSNEVQMLDVGTVDYVPPEQFKNVPPNVQFDIYAAGLMAYQLLTGHVPYTGNTSESLVYQKLYVEPHPLSKWRQDIPARLADVVLRAIASDPLQRYSTWKALTDDLEGTISTADSTREVANDSSKYASLSKLEFFREFDQKELWETIQISSWIRFKAGQAIFSEGHAGTNINVIIIGEADVLKGYSKIDQVKQGNCFGELAYIDKVNQLRTTSVVASTMLVALCIDCERLHNASDGLHARFSHALLRGALGKIAQYDRQLTAMSDPLMQTRLPRASLQTRKSLSPATKLDSVSDLQTDSKSVRLQLRAGDSLQIQSLNSDSEKYGLKFIGAIKGECILLTLPFVDGKAAKMPKGQGYLIRGFDGKHAFAFTSHVIQTRFHPFPDVHFSYPVAVEHKVIRKALRVSVNLPALVIKANEQIHVTIINLSAKGLMIDSSQSIGEIGDMINVQFEVSLEDVKANLTLPAKIRNANNLKEESGTHIGVEFENISQNDMLILKNLILATSIDGAAYH